MFVQVIQGRTSQPQALLDALKAFRTSGYCSLAVDQPQPSAVEG
jgi:hypothetical protein